MAWQEPSLLWGVCVGWLEKLKSRHGTQVCLFPYRLSATAGGSAEAGARQVFVPVG